jgi:hypothetical protein
MAKAQFRGCLLASRREDAAAKQVGSCAPVHLTFEYLYVFDYAGSKETEAVGGAFRLRAGRLRSSRGQLIGGEDGRVGRFRLGGQDIYDPVNVGRAPSA